MGLRTLPVPESRGGGSADLLSLCFVAEEIGWGDLGVGVIYAQDWALASTISRLREGADFETFAENYTGSHACHLAHVKIGETPAPDARNPYKADADQGASVRQDGDAWYLQGTARHVLNGAAAGFFLLESSLDDENERRIFLLENRGGPRNLESLVIMIPMGMRSCQDVDLRFDDVEPGLPLDCTEEDVARRGARHPHSPGGGGGRNGEKIPRTRARPRP